MTHPHGWTQNPPAAPAAAYAESHSKGSRACEQEEWCGVIPEIKGIYLTDFSSFEEYSPEDPFEFSFDLRVLIGPQHHDAADSFSFTICTPSWVAKECSVDGFIWRWDILIVSEFNRSQITKIIEKFVSRSGAPTWHQIGEKISRRSNWEFDNYT